MSQVVSLAIHPPSLETLYLDADVTSFALENLQPGGSYELRLSSMYSTKESLEHLSTNITTSKKPTFYFI